MSSSDVVPALPLDRFPLPLRAERIGAGVPWPVLLLWLALLVGEPIGRRLSKVNCSLLRLVFVLHQSCVLPLLQEFLALIDLLVITLESLIGALNQVCILCAGQELLRHFRVRHLRRVVVIASKGRNPPLLHILLSR